MPKVNLVAHGIQVELEAAEVSISELGARALEMLKMALETGKTEPVGFGPEKSLAESL